MPWHGAKHLLHRGLACRFDFLLDGILTLMQLKAIGLKPLMQKLSQWGAFWKVAKKTLHPN